MDKSNIARAGTAAALLLVAGQAEAATFSISLDQLLTTGGGALQGQFDISSLLLDSNGQAYRAIAATVTAFGYSDAVQSLQQVTGYGPSTLVNSYYSPGYHSSWGGSYSSYYSATYNQTRYVNVVDNVADKMQLVAGTANGTGTVGSQVGDYGPLTANGSYWSYSYYSSVTTYYYDYLRNTGSYGDLSAFAVLGEGDLSALTTSGLLDYTVSSLTGQMHVTNLALDVELEEIATGVPEPTTWAMFVAGIGAIGAGMRKRKRPVESLA